MKIVLIIKKFSRYGGVENFCYQFFDFLKKKGCPVQVLCGENLTNESGEQIRTLGLLRPGRFFKLLGFWLRTKRFLRELDSSCVTFAFTPVPGCDIVRSGGSHFDFMRKTTAAQPDQWARRGKIFRRALAPINYFQYVLDFFIYSRKSHTRHIAISSNVRDELLHRYDLPESRIVLMPNGVDISRFNYSLTGEKRETSRQKLGVAPKHKVLGFCSTNFELKGLRYLIEALALLDPQTVLVVAGRRNPQDYRLQAKRLGVEERVLFLGGVEEMQEFYASLDALIHPSFYDTFGNVVVESLAMGVPVLTTSLVGASDCIQPGVNGFLADPKKTDDFARAIRDTLELGVRDYSFSVADTSVVFEKYYRIARDVYAERTRA